MRIAIFDFTLQGDPIFDGIPRVGKTIERWIAPAMPGSEFGYYGITYGDDLPDLETFDGLLLSGSELGVYDNPPWMKPLREYLPKVRAAKKPIFGICFGHQLMADVFGGKAEKSIAGNHVGVRQFELNGETVDAMVWHKDQVTRVPPGAQVTGSAPYCPVGALDYDFPAKSIQFHPEFSEQNMTELFDLGDVLIDPSEAAEARKTFANSSVRADLMAKETAEFFYSHLKA